MKRITIRVTEIHANTPLIDLQLKQETPLIIVKNKNSKICPRGFGLNREIA